MDPKQPADIFSSQEAGCQANMAAEEVLFAFQKQRSEEREISRKIQQLLLSYHGPLPISELSVHMTTSSSLDADGDFLDFYQISPSCLDVVIGNVMGKGLPAVVIATVVKTQFIRFALPTHRVQLCHNANTWQDDLLMPDEIIARVLKEVQVTLTQLEHFVSLFYGRFDFQKQLFFYVNCGLAAPLYFQPKTSRIQELSAKHPPLGVQLDDAYMCQQISFGYEDLFLFYSDGILRTQTVNGEFFNVERLKQMLITHHTLNIHLLRKVIEEEVLAFFAPLTLHDSFTIIVIRIPENKPVGPSESKMAKFSSDITQTEAVRQFIQSTFCQVPGDCEQFIQKMQLCVHEIFCNLIIHAYANQRRGEVIISCQQLEEGGLVEIADQGCEFDPSKVAYPNFFGDDAHGFGWYIIRKLADQVTYVGKSSPHGWNHLRIFKKYIPREVP